MAEKHKMKIKFVAITFMSQIKYGYFPFSLRFFLIEPQEWKKNNHHMKPKHNGKV